MTARHLLFVEDNDRQQMLFRDAVEAWNAENTDRSFTHEIVGSYDEGLEALNLKRFDGALFDLRIPASKTDTREAAVGNDLAKIGLHCEGIPVAILSGLPGEADPEFARSNTVKIFDKGKERAFDDAIAWFGGLWLMLETLASARREIRQRSASLFVERIWPRWQTYREIADDKKDLTPVLARQFVWHLGEVMGLGGEGGDEWHPLEGWICPPLDPTRASTGDVISLDGSLWIVLTPPCDLANDGKIANVLLARVDQDGFEDWGKAVEKVRIPDRRDNGLRILRKFMNQALAAQHVLPALPGNSNPAVVDFTHLRTVPFAEFRGQLSDRVGTVAAPFISNLIQRFGSYISRVGQPNLNVAEMVTD